MTDILQITPYLPPAVSGVGDHANIIEKKLIDNGWTIESISTESIKKNRSGTFSFGNGKEKTEALLEQMYKKPHQTILLHYVCYGFHKYGVPFWLIRALKKFTKDPRNRLITFYHELYAFGPPHRSEFWLSLIQRNLIKRVFKYSSAHITNCHKYQKQLLLWNPKAEIKLAFVFSNIGEPSNIGPKKQGSCAIFGSPGRRRRIYRNLEPYLKSLKKLGVDKFIDIGNPLPENELSKFRHLIETTGFVTPQKASEILSAAEFGLAYYNPDEVQKSGIFAAYLAHDTKIINLTEQNTFGDLSLHQEEYESRSISHTISTVEEALSEIKL